MNEKVVVLAEFVKKRDQHRKETRQLLNEIANTFLELSDLLEDFSGLARSFSEESPKHLP